MQLDVCGVVVGQQCMSHNANATNIAFIVMLSYTVYVMFDMRGAF